MLQGCQVLRLALPAGSPPVSPALGASTEKDSAEDPGPVSGPDSKAGGWTGQFSSLLAPDRVLGPCSIHVARALSLSPLLLLTSLFLFLSPPSPPPSSVCAINQYFWTENYMPGTLLNVKYSPMHKTGPKRQ